RMPMVSAPYVLGIDIGTTTCRCAIFDLAGNEIASAYRETAVSYPRPLWAEVDPEEWWRGTVRGLPATLARRRVRPEASARGGWPGLMDAGVVLDADGRAIIAAQLWMDQRCAPQCEAMNRERLSFDAQETHVRHFSTSFTAPKLRWLAETQPEVLAQARTLLL